MNGMNQQRYRFNVDKYISNSKQVFTVQKPRVQLRLQPQPHQALAPVVVAHTPVAAAVPKPVVVAAPKPVVVAAPKPVPAPVAVAKAVAEPVPVQRLVSLKPGHTKAHVKNDNILVSIKPAPVQAPVAAPKRSSNLIKLK